MRQITYREALNEALREELGRDERVFLLGEVIGRDWEGAFKVTKDLAAEFGDERVGLNHQPKTAPEESMPRISLNHF